MTPISDTQISAIVTLHNEYIEISETARKATLFILNSLEDLRQNPSIKTPELIASVEAKRNEVKGCIPKYWRVCREIVALIAPFLNNMKACRKISHAIHPESPELQNAYYQCLINKDFSFYIPKPILS